MSRIWLKVLRMAFSMLSGNSRQGVVVNSNFDRVTWQILFKLSYEVAGDQPVFLA